MSEAKLILVFGATGQQGGAVADALLERGYRIRAATRHPDSEAAIALRERGAEIVQADFADSTSLQAAMQGVDTVYLMGTPFEVGIEREVAQGIAAIDAAKAAGIEHLIYSSVASANQATGIPHFESKFEVEQFLAASGLNYTIVAPVFFMENLLQPWAGSLTEARLTLAMPEDRTLQQISVASIGSFVAAIVDRGASEYGKRYDIAGADLSGASAAAVLGHVSGRSFEYQGFPPDALREQSEDMALMFEWFIETGYSVDLARLRTEFPEVKWLSFEQWAETVHWPSPALQAD